VVLMCKVPTFCHPFFISETRKFIDIIKFCLRLSSPVYTLPMAVPKHEAFLDWNLTVCFNSSILAVMFSPSANVIGNRPIFTSTFPRSLVVCFATESLAKSTSYFLAHFLILVLSLLKAFSPSTSM
jgi:hypothetical protein